MLGRDMTVTTCKGLFKYSYQYILNVNVRKI